MGTDTPNGAFVVRSGYLSLATVLLAFIGLSTAQPVAPFPDPALPMPLAPELPELPLPPSPPLLIESPLPPSSSLPPPAAPAVGPCPAVEPAPVPAPPDCKTGTVCTGQAPHLPSRFFERERSDRGPRLWGSAEFLLWNISDYAVPPLVTTGPAQFPVGFLGNPGTQILFGGSSLNSNVFPGGRFMAGIWFGECVRVGLEADYFFLAEQSMSTAFNSDAYPVLARPFTNANTGGQFSEFGAFPGIATGGMSIDTTAELWGAGVRFRQPLWGACRGGVDLLAGFQYLSLQESLTMTETPTFLPGGPFPELSGLSFIAVDRFATRNQFYGGQLGIAARHRRGNWLIDLRSPHRHRDDTPGSGHPGRATRHRRLRRSDHLSGWAARPAGREHRSYNAKRVQCRTSSGVEPGLPDHRPSHFVRRVHLTVLEQCRSTRRPDRPGSRRHANPKLHYERGTDEPSAAN